MQNNESPQWVEAMNIELKAYADYGSWTLVQRTMSTCPVGCRWVFAKKRDECGRVVRHIDRLVAKGSKQKFFC
ncbi:polyprotein [Phytophthora megakarya]|uniref:Polyprotein n=1 Tax=Phytophthora megakarya TaxID=4795 RepID=A0A225W2Q6_9STRA|nr:polyprotein [Phytophthora megakarya]